MANLIQYAKDQVTELTRKAYEAAAAEGILPAGAELKGSVEDGVKPESPNDYTPAIYSTRMMNAGKIPVTYTGGTPLVARPSADADAYQTNTTIRDMVRTPVKGATLEDLPGDETVFAYLRANQIEMKINGQVVENEKLNTTYFGKVTYKL